MIKNNRIQSVWTKISNHASIRIGHYLVINRPDDRFLVSYPRSGNTWMRTILVNLLMPEANSNPDVFNRRLPGVSIRRSRLINSLPSPRIIKSHTWYRSDIPRAVYIIRDGRDSLSSFYYYLTTRQGISKSFPEFFDEYQNGYYGYRWDEHVISWLQTGKEKLGDNLFIVKFEQLKQETQQVVGKVSTFLQLSSTPIQIQKAIEAASLKNMQQIELQRKDVDLSNPNASFYRGGKTKQWKTLFTPEITKKFMDLSSEAMELAEYEC